MQTVLKSAYTVIFEQSNTLHSLLDMHMDFSGAQTEVSKQRHTLYNLLHMNTDLTCATK